MKLSRSTAKTYCAVSARKEVVADLLLLLPQALLRQIPRRIVPHQHVAARLGQTHGKGKQEHELSTREAHGHGRGRGKTETRREGQVQPGGIGVGATSGRAVRGVNQTQPLV